MNKQKTLVLVSALAIVAIFFGGYKWYNAELPKPATERFSDLVKDYNHSVGPDDAKVVLVEFFDPECEACKAYHPIIEDVKKQYEGDIKVVMRYMLYHNNSLNAARALEAAAKQGKFWEFQAHLFTNLEWSHKKTPQHQQMFKYATDMGLNLDQFVKDYNDDFLINRIKEDMAGGQNLGVRGTPTIYINGEKLQSLKPELLHEKIRSFL